MPELNLTFCRNFVKPYQFKLKRAGYVRQYLNSNRRKRNLCNTRSRRKRRRRIVKSTHVLARDAERRSFLDDSSLDHYADHDRVPRVEHVLKSKCRFLFNKFRRLGSDIAGARKLSLFIGVLSPSRNEFARILTCGRIFNLHGNTAICLFSSRLRCLSSSL